MKILYSQCWEDPLVLSRGLEVTPSDDVLSVASGGDNSLALLLDNPRSIIAIDQNPAQIYLVELKMEAIKHLYYKQFTGFIGASPESDRWRIYYHLRRHLSRASKEYWDKNIDLINRGIIHAGKFEKYFHLFYRYILPLIHNRQTVDRFLGSPNSSYQKVFYHRFWNSHRWKYFFRIFFSKFILSRFGRSSEFFKYVSARDISKILYDRTEHGLTDIPTKNNFYVEYILSGGYHSADSVPPYMDPRNYDIIKNRLDRMKLVCGNLEEYLKGLPENSFSKFNLSDSLEYMSRETIRELLQSIIRVSRPNARLALWTLFVPQSIPEDMRQSIISLDGVGRKLSSNARAFFYNDFCLWQLTGV